MPLVASRPAAPAAPASRASRLAALAVPGTLLALGTIAVGSMAGSHAAIAQAIHAAVSLH